MSDSAVKLELPHKQDQETGVIVEGFQRTDTERLVQLLDQEIRSRGRGAIRAVDRAAGYRDGWWLNRAASGNLTVHQLFVVLEHLGLDPVRFVRRALGRDERLVFDRPRGQPPEMVARAWERFETEVPFHGVGKQFLESLDHRRFGDPRGVLALAKWAVDSVEVALLPQLLGVAGSTWRLLIRLDEAEHAIHAGIALAQKLRQRSVVGNLLQRLAYVVADRGDRAEALSLSEQAAMVFLRCDDRSALGKALVDQGIWLYYLNRYEESIEAHRSAEGLLTGEGLLPTERSRNRVVVLQYQGLNCLALGNLEEALQWAREAERLARETGVDEWARPKLLWLFAKVRIDLGALDQAAYDLEEIVELYRELHAGEAALATCELVRVRLLQGRAEEATLASLAMRSFIEPLRHNKIISAAIGDLLRYGQAGLTLTLVEQVMSHIEHEREQGQRWQELRIEPKT